MDAAPSPERRRSASTSASAGLAVVQAFSMWNRTDEALDAILAVERIAPEQIRHHYLSRQLVLSWIRRQRGKPSRPLADLGRRLHAA